jgi:diguanylate cyclase (GGDEF)-like protein/PAS domain S-box-containing protein
MMEDQSGSGPEKIDDSADMKQVVSLDVSQLKRMLAEQHRNREVAERLAEEMAIIAEIGRVIGSTLDIDEVYEKFAAEARKLIPFDRLVVNLNELQDGVSRCAYVYGMDVPGRRPGDTIPLAGTINGIILRTRSSMIVQSARTEESIARFPELGALFATTGLRSLMSIPLIYGDEVVGALHFTSIKPEAYTDNDMRLAERIGSQIVGAIANAQLYKTFKKTEASLRESEERFRVLFEQAAVGVAEIEIKTGRYITVNQRLCEITGRTEEEMLSTTVMTMTHPDDLHLHEDKLALLLAGKVRHYNYEKRYIRKDGTIIWVDVMVSQLWKSGNARKHIIVVIQDITGRKQMEEEIREMSLRDWLTGLYNRRGFVALAEQQLKAAGRAKRQMQFAFADIDGLKWINDNLGHEEGDKVLIETADILRQTFREADIIARLGGDEFAILAIDMTDLNPEAFAKRLQQNIDECNAKQSRRYKLAVSWGAVIYDPGSPLSLDRLMSSADDLMYTQKKAKSAKIN